MLVVTFTDRAAAELAPPHRRAHREGARHGARRRRAERRVAWTDRRRRRARGSPPPPRALDGAPISTIHAFCQRVLTEQAFAGGRLLVQQSVESRAAFAAAFAEVLRQELAVDPEQRPLPRGVSGARRAPAVDSLEELLYRAHQLRASWGTPLDPERIAAAARAFARLAPAELEARLRGTARVRRPRRCAARLRMLHAAARRFDADGETRALPGRARRSGARTTCSPSHRAARERAHGERRRLLVDGAGRRGGPAGRGGGAALRAAGRRRGWRRASAPPASTTSTTCWPWSPRRWPARAAPTWSRRCGGATSWRSSTSFRTPIQVQWEIFRTIFDDGAGASPLYLVGDPKQAIYGFRGADVATYAAARDTVAAADERPPPARGTFAPPARVIDAYNAILDQTAAEPFFDRGDVR